MSIIRITDYNIATKVVGDIVDFGDKGVKKWDGERWLHQPEVSFDGNNLNIGSIVVPIVQAESPLDMASIKVNELSGYSETEILTEKRWIDGKPIYRRVTDASIVDDASIVILNESTYIDKIVTEYTKVSDTDSTPVATPNLMVVNAQSPDIYSTDTEFKTNKWVGSDADGYKVVYRILSDGSISTFGITVMSETTYNGKTVTEYIKTDDTPITRATLDSFKSTTFETSSDILDALPSA